MAALRNSRPSWCTNQGVTLIELLIALVVFGVLGVMGYRAVAIAVESRGRVVAELQRWREIAGFFQVLENDLAQYAERPQPTSSMGYSVADTLHVSVASDGQTEFSFLRLDGAGGGARRRGYRFEPGRIMQLRWPGTDSISTPTSYTLLDNVTRLQATVLDAKGVQLPQWPSLQPGATVVPVAIDIQLELPDAGTIHRLIALR